MSIDEQHAEPSLTAHASEKIQSASTLEINAGTFTGDSADNVAAERKRWSKVLLSPLWLCLLVALLIRVWLTLRTHGVLDGDEALLGIQAERILHGNFPAYFYGIPYFGSLEAYLVAIIFAIFGPSVAGLRAETTIIGLTLVASTWWLASLLADVAKLPHYAKRIFTTVAALIAALPPVYDGIIELRTGGGWIESFVLMVLLLISVLRLTTRWRAGASNRELAWRWAIVGFVVGFAMWIYPLVAMSIVASALWIILDRLVDIFTRVRAAEPLASALWRSLKGFLLVPFAIPACAIGFLPGIFWGATHQWANITYLFSLGGGWSRQRLHTISLVARLYGSCVAPRVISGATPMESNVLAAIHTPLLMFSLVCIGTTVALVGVSLVWQQPVLARARRLAALPAIFGFCTAALFCTSSASVSGLMSCNADFAGHYASPLILAIPFAFATVFALVSMFFVERSRRTEQQPASVNDELRSQTVRIASRKRRPVVALVVLFALLLAYLGGQTVTYGLTNPDSAFQSSYCTIAPANYGPIIAYMQQQHIKYAWASNLLGYQISFETNNSIILADPLALIHPAISINRIPSYTDAVKNADRPSFLLFVKHGDTHSHLLQALDSEQVTYRVAYFPSEPGVDVMVVTPLSRTVSPLTSKAFDIFYCGTS